MIPNRNDLVLSAGKHFFDLALDTVDPIGEKTRGEFDDTPLKAIIRISRLIFPL
jgi:hypothetical protein